MDSSAVIVKVQPEQQERLRRLESFSFRHALGEHPAMTLDGIQKLTARLLQDKRFDQIYFKRNGKSHFGNAENASEVLASLESLDKAGAWFRLTRVDDINEEFRGLSEQFYTDLSTLLETDIRAQILKTFVTLFVTSPNEITSYHMDHTWNFLLQIQGSKTVHLFDARDPRVVRQKDREDFYMDCVSLPKKKDEFGIAYDLSPGIGVHHPVHAPHWVQNGPQISVSLSFGLCLHSSNYDAKVHQINFMLRKMGLNPLPPRQSKWRDSIKAGAISLVSDRKPESFNDVLFSGVRRIKRVLKTVRIVR